MVEPRVPEALYGDPLDEVWLGCARRIGLEVVRDSEVNAATDGRGVLTVGRAEALDPDDCLAQLVFHELCHSLVEGVDSFARSDWGLDNTSERDVVREHACLRAQAVLAGRYGLRRVLAPTTDFRAFHDALPVDPLADRADASVPPAIRAVQRADEAPWAPHLTDALEATASIVRAAAPFASDVPGRVPRLLARADEPPARHPLGPAVSSVAGRTCGSCAWRHRGGRGRPVDRCRQLGDRRLERAWAACERWEPELDCRQCGACCRGAYDLVIVPPRDPVLAAHPELIDGGRDFHALRRAGDRCAALEGGDATPFACAIYEERPRPCRDFEIAGEHCLTARRRVGLSL